MIIVINLRSIVDVLHVTYAHSVVVNRCLPVILTLIIIICMSMIR